MADVRSTTLVVQLLLLIGIASAQFKLSVVVPDGTTKDTVVTFSGLKETLSISSPMPHLITGSETDPKNQVTIKAAAKLNCKLPIVVIGKKPDGTSVTYTGEVQVTPIGPSDVNQAVTVAGDTDKLDTLVKELEKTYGVVVVAQEPGSPGNPGTISVVLKDKTTGKVIPKDEAEKIIEVLLKTITGPGIHRPDCYSTCNDICGSVLAIDTSSNAIKPVEVASQSGSFYGTLRTRLEHKCGKDYLRKLGGVCVPSSTCANGGTCRAGESGTSPGLCSCKPATNEVYGPTCQLLTRGYLSAGPSSSAITHHSISDSNTYSYRLDLSFQHAGKCTLTSGSLCTILKLEIGGREVLKVEQGRVVEPQYNSATLPVKPAGESKMAFYADRYVENQRWMDATVAVEFSGKSFKATTVFCSKEVTSACYKETATGSLAGDAKQAKGELSIGGTFNGCFRNVRVNGRLVDLQPDRVTGDAALTKDTCASQDASCGGGGGSGYTCGANSVCYGQLGGKTAAMTCGCGCTNDHRMTSELVTRSSQCAISCSKATPIVSTGSSSHSMQWAMSDGRYISVPSGDAPLTLLLRFRTRQSSALGMLKIDGSSGASAVLKIDNEVLTLCLSSRCYPFVPVLVNDGRWHEVFVSLAQTQLVTRVDDRARVHTNVAATDFVSVKVSMDLPSSCISNVRVSDIYMPTGDSDATQDSSSVAVRASFGSGATAAGKCNAP